MRRGRYFENTWNRSQFILRYTTPCRDLSKTALFGRFWDLEIKETTVLNKWQKKCYEIFYRLDEFVSCLVRVRWVSALNERIFVN